VLLVMMDGGGDHGMMGWMAGWMALWGLLALALVVLAVVATVWLVKHLSGSGRSSAEQALERRYAAGDIDREEFLRRREDLRYGG
jgi:putative membrane protein